jgi:LacI family transcriptional regulator
VVTFAERFQVGETGVASIRDVARAAGVSTATVSHTLNGTRTVSEERRARVHQAAEELGYRLPGSARTRRRVDSRLIGHLLTSVSGSGFHAMVALGVEQRAADSGFGVLLSVGATPSLGRSRVRQMIGHGISGLIVTSGNDAETIDAARQANIPVVVVERTADRDGVGFVAVDQFGGAETATSALLDLGHTRLGLLGVEPRDGSWADVDRERRDGFLAALAARGLLPYALELVPPGPPDDRKIADERAAAHRLLAGPLRPTAILAVSDQKALTVLQAAHELGLRVPDDLSVIGWDDTVAALGAPPLTSVAMPFGQMGQSAVDLLTELIDGTRRVDEAVVTLAPTLTWRRSASVPIAI